MAAEGSSNQDEGADNSKDQADYCDIATDAVEDEGFVSNDWGDLEDQKNSSGQNGGEVHDDCDAVDALSVPVPFTCESIKVSTCTVRIRR
jgi:hypothetical protein